MTPPILTALAPDGRRLPVIDVTHPAFVLHHDEAEVRRRLDAFVREDDQLARLPDFLRKPLLRFLLRGSVFARALGAADGTYLGAVDTYTLKLGPKNLGAWAKPIDRKIAAAAPALAIRLRLQDMAELIAGAVAPALAAEPTRALRFVSLAGGTAIDVLNALIVLRKGGTPLGGRTITIEVLDLEAGGPSFGHNALLALQGPGAPLEGLTIGWLHTTWRWTELDRLSALLESSDAITVASSEGGLFEYGSDREIVDVLDRLARWPEVRAMVGSVTSASDLVRRVRKDGGAATIARGAARFAEVIAGTAWRIEETRARPMSDDVRLVRR